jgi:hypothetical protein
VHVVVLYMRREYPDLAEQEGSSSSSSAAKASSSSHLTHCSFASVFACYAYARCREYPDLAEQEGSSSSSSSSGGVPRFKLALHCGGCMIDAQKMRARIADMEDAGAPGEEGLTTSG